MGIRDYCDSGTDRKWKVVCHTTSVIGYDVGSSFLTQLWQEMKERLAFGNRSSGVNAPPPPGMRGHSSFG